MIEALHTWVSQIGIHIIRGIFISVLFILFVRLFLKDYLETTISLQIIRWVMIIYAIGAFISYFLVYLFPPSESFAFLDRAQGPYAWAYWLMVFGNILLPLLLLKKKIGSAIYVILIIAVMMNIGWLFELFVIKITALHGDYSIPSKGSYFSYGHELMILFKGLTLGLLALLIGNGISKLRATN